MGNHMGSCGNISWIILPIGVSLYLLPHFGTFYSNIPISVLIPIFLFGCMWGIGSVSYGLTMRYLGMSLWPAPQNPPLPNQKPFRFSLSPQPSPER